MILEGYRTHRGVTGPMKFKEIGRFFFGKSCSRGFGAPGCHPSTLIDLVNSALASRGSIKPICMFSEGYRTHRGVTGPMNFKEKGRFFGKSCSRGFGAPGCHPSSLIDLVNTALASQGSGKPTRMISEGYRTHRGVTGSMNFKKTGFFLGKSCSRDFGAPGCYLSTLIDLANTALASRGSIKPICMISEGYRTHRGVTGPMNFKETGRFFGKSCSRGFGSPGCHPGTLFDLVNTALASGGSEKPICMNSEGYRTHRGVTGPMNFKKSAFFRKIVLPEFWGPWLPSGHFI